MTEEQYSWEKAEFQDPEAHRKHVENYMKGIRDSTCFDQEYSREAVTKLLKEALVNAAKILRDAGYAEIEIRRILVAAYNNSGI